MFRDQILSEFLIEIRKKKPMRSIRYETIEQDQIAQIIPVHMQHIVTKLAEVSSIIPMQCEATHLRLRWCFWKG